MSEEYTENLEEIATYGFDTIDPNEIVSVNLKDLMYVFATLQEYQRFFHQPMHYQKINDVERFLGSVNNHAAYKMLHTSIHKKMSKMLPAHIEGKYSEGVFESRKLPFYFYKAK